VSKVDLYAGSFTFTVSGKEYTVSVPAIISEEEAEEVRRMAEVGRKRCARKRTTRHDFPMARRLSCAMCNYSYQVNYDKKGYCYYRCWGTNMKAAKVCSEMPVPRNKVDDKAKEFIRDLLLNPRRLFAWWQERHAKTVEGQTQLLEDLAALQNRSRITTEKYRRTLDRLTDNLDADETAYYNQQRDNLKELLAEYREGMEQLTAKQEDTADVPEELITDFMVMGAAYRESWKRPRTSRFGADSSTTWTLPALLARKMSADSLISLCSARPAGGFTSFRRVILNPIRKFNRHL
jgi:hypothetical protein